MLVLRFRSIFFKNLKICHITIKISRIRYVNRKFENKVNYDDT